MARNKHRLRTCRHLGQFFIRYICSWTLWRGWKHHSTLFIWSNTNPDSNTNTNTNANTYSDTIGKCFTNAKYLTHIYSYSNALHNRHAHSNDHSHTDSYSHAYTNIHNRTYATLHTHTDKIGQVVQRNYIWYIDSCFPDNIDRFDSLDRLPTAQT